MLDLALTRDEGTSLNDPSLKNNSISLPCYLSASPFESPASAQSLTGGKACRTLPLTVEQQIEARDFNVIKEISRGTMSTVYYCEGGIALKSMG